MTPLAEALRAVGLLAPLDEAQLRWVAERGEVRALDAGAVIARQGDPADGLFLVLAGRVEWTREVGGRDVHAVTLGPGEIFGELIVILDQPYPTTGTALEPTTLLRLDPSAFWELAGRSPEVLRELVRVAVQRAEIHEGVSQLQARLVSLGTMAAGLAHELDNPAAAAGRAARELPAAMAAARLPDPDVEEALAAADPARVARLDPLDRAEAEDALLARLEASEVPEADRLAPELVDAGVAPEALAGLGPDALARLAAAASARELARSIEDATARISALVASVKAYSYMDADASPRPLDVRPGIETTLELLEHRFREKRIRVQRGLGAALPPVLASGGDLNQVWTQLLANAIDAVAPGGWIEVRARSEPGWVVVEVADDGPGVPEAIAGRIFEPFFTTKGVGEGTGLGLDIVARIVGAAGGQVRLDSAGGPTVFAVRLPVGGGGAGPAG